MTTRVESKSPTPHNNVERVRSRRPMEHTIKQSTLIQGCGSIGGGISSRFIGGGNGSGCIGGDGGSRGVSKWVVAARASAARASAARATEEAFSIVGIS